MINNKLAVALILVGCIALTGCKAGASDDSIHKCVILSNNTIRVYSDEDSDKNLIIPKNNIVGTEFEKLSGNEYKIVFYLRFPVTHYTVYEVTCNGDLDIIKDWIQNDNFE